MQCPKCKLDRAHRSHRKGVWERIVSLIGYYPFRCRQCEHRFLQYRYLMPKAERGEPSSAEREIRSTRMKLKRKHKMREFMLYALGMLLFCCFLYYITRPD